MTADLITQRIPIGKAEFLPSWAQDVASKSKADVFIRKGLTPEDTKFAEGERASIDRITTKRIDRDGEIVLPKGAILDDYRKHPIVLWAHKYDELGLGRNMWIKADDEGLIAKTEYATHPKAQEVYEYRKAGFPLAKSIGFIPVEAIEQKDFDNVDLKSLGLTKEDVQGARRIYTKWILLEYSDVPIPSNPDALQIAISKGLIDREEALEFYGPWDSKGELVSENLPWIEERYGKISTKKEEPKEEEVVFEIVEEKSGEKEVVNKPETTDNYHRVPVPAEEGKHDGHKIRTIDISKEQGIKALYCVDCKKNITYLFDVNKWSMEEAQQWVADHTKETKKDPVEEKSISGDKNLPLDQTTSWDAAAVEARIRKWAGGPDKDKIDWKKYGKAFVVVDPANKENFTGYKLLFADVIGGTLKATRGGVINAMRAVLGARGGVNLSEGERKAAYNFLVAYYKRFDMKPPEYKTADEEKEATKTIIDELVKDIDLGKYEAKEPEYKERWNKSLSKTFDVQAVDVPASSFVFELYSKYLGCKIKDVYCNSFTIPSPLMGTYLTAYKNLVGQLQVIDIRNFADHGAESPLVFEVVQLNSSTKEDFLIKGMVFARSADGIPVVVRYKPTWYGIVVDVVTSNKYRKWNVKQVDEVHAWAKENNFLKGEKFALNGEFIGESEEGWDDLVIDKSLERTLKNSMKVFNEAGKALKSRGLLMIGPPGTGKTLTGKILKNSTDHTFIWVSSKDLASVGSVRGVGLAYSLARDLAPAIIFMEDIDSWLHGSVIDVLKTEMDGLRSNGGVMTVLTSNHPEQLPDALLDRPGRFHDILNYNTPNEETRMRMIQRWAGEIDPDVVEDLAKSTVGFSGAHMRELIEFAEALHEDGQELSMEDALYASLGKINEQRELISSIRQKPEAKEPEAEVVEKAGRVLSEKNRRLISDVITKMKTAIAALDELLKATEQSPTSTPGKELNEFEIELDDEVVGVIKEPEAEEVEVEELDTDEMLEMLRKTISEELMGSTRSIISDLLKVEIDKARGKVMYEQ